MRRFIKTQGVDVVGNTFCTGIQVFFPITDGRNVIFLIIGYVPLVLNFICFTGSSCAKTVIMGKRAKNNNAVFFMLSLL
jgi:hypothetical protein